MVAQSTSALQESLASVYLYVCFAVIVLSILRISVKQWRKARDTPSYTPYDGDVTAGRVSTSFTEVAEAGVQTEITQTAASMLTEIADASVQTLAQACEQSTQTAKTVTFVSNVVTVPSPSSPSPPHDPGPPCEGCGKRPSLPIVPRPCRLCGIRLCVDCVISHHCVEIGTPPPLALTHVEGVVSRSAKRTMRSRAYAHARDRRRRIIDSAPITVWRAWLAAAGFFYKLRAQLKHRERVLLRCTLMLRPACGRFISILRQRRRLQALQLLATAPCSLPYDVGYDVDTESFTFRDVCGELTHIHPTTGADAPDIYAYNAEGLQVAPLSPPDSGTVVLRPESRGGWCYYDTACGMTSWFAPPGSGVLVQCELKEWPLPERPPPELERDVCLNSLSRTSWSVLFLDTSSQVLLVHMGTGAVREAPWVCLRTDDGVAFFANLVTRETRWLPPHRWMNGWLYRRDAGAELLAPNRHPYGHVEDIVPLSVRTMPAAAYARRSVEGGAPYLHEGGLPQYPPDSSDTNETYPLDDVTESSSVTPTSCARSADVTQDTPTSDDVTLTGYDLAWYENAVSHLYVESAWRACGVIERAWLRYAITVLGPDVSGTAERAEAEDVQPENPPYRFWVRYTQWTLCDVSPRDVD